MLPIHSADLGGVLGPGVLLIIDATYSSSVGTVSIIVAASRRETYPFPGAI